MDAAIATALNRIDREHTAAAANSASAAKRLADQALAPRTQTHVEEIVSASLSVVRSQAAEDVFLSVKQAADWANESPLSVDWAGLVWSLAMNPLRTGDLRGDAKIAYTEAWSRAVDGAHDVLAPVLAAQAAQVTA